MKPGPNGIGMALGLLGDEWNLLLVRQALGGPRRYGELQLALGIGPSVLSARLSALTAGGVLEKRSEGYLLTASGKDLWALLLTIWAWEQKWVQGSGLPTMRHATCGAVFTPLLCCSACSRPAAAPDVDLELEPAGTMSRSVPAGTNRRRTGAHRIAGPGLFPETMSLLGSRWSAGLLGCAFLGAHRFRQYEVMLGAPTNVVADRLRTFVELGVLGQDYRLSAKGLEFFPTVALLVSWGETWHLAADGPALIARHEGCGQRFVPRLHCSACRVVLDRPDVKIESPHEQATSSAVLQRTT